MANKTDTLLNTKNKGVNYIKNKAFDIIAVGIVIAVTALSLGVTELREITLNTMADLLLECLPFYVAAVMLSSNYYSKGVFVGKDTDTFKNCINYYSELVNDIDGERLGYLPQFCTEYNSKTIKDKQITLLRSVAITYKLFNEGDKDIAPLKTIPKKKLKRMFDKNTAKVIEKCKKIKVKGIHPNILLGSLNINDNTDLGDSEKDLRLKRKLNYAGTYILTIFLMSLIGVKNIMQWGWMGAALTLFKILYISLGAYTKYFNGYEDLTVNVVNHTYRKVDVLKQFNHWYGTVSKSSDEVIK